MDSQGPPGSTSAPTIEVPDKHHDSIAILPCSFQSALPPLEAFDKMVSVKVGFDDLHTETFQIYRGLLSWHSPYFNTLFIGPFKEGGSDEIVINDISAEDFKAVYYWLNTRRLYVPSEGKVPLTFARLIRIYIFADAHIIPRLKNAAVEAVAEKVVARSKGPYPHTVEHLYENTAGDCPMRAMLVRIAIELWGWKGEMAEHFCADYMLNITKAVCENIENYAKFTAGPFDRAKFLNDVQNNICQFHDHSS
jgi:hypothetical protein